MILRFMSLGLLILSVCACNPATPQHSQAPLADDSAAYCPPLRYAENPTEAVSALPVKFGGAILADPYVTTIHDVTGVGVTEEVNGLKFETIISSTSILQSESSSLQMHYEQDGMHFDFQTFYKFKLHSDSFSVPLSSTADGQYLRTMLLSFIPEQIAHRPWFLLIPDSTCQSRVKQVVRGSMTSFEFEPVTSNTSYRFVESVTHPTAGHVVISWYVINADVSRWMYLGFITKATEILMSSGEDSQGRYLSMEKHHFGSGLTVVEQCGRLYNPAVTDIVSFQRTTTDSISARDWEEEQVDFRDTWQKPLNKEQLTKLVYWWNYLRGGLPIDFGNLVNPESAVPPLEESHLAKVQIGSCARIFHYYYWSCVIGDRFRPDSMRSCDFDFYFGGTPEYRLLFGGSTTPFSGNIWAYIMRH